VKDYDGTEREAPADYGNPFALDNHPVVGGTWYEAMAYCRWLTERLRKAKDESSIRPDEEVRLPTEAEWEKAARGTDGRPYPWGNEPPDPNRANYKDTGIGSASAVGCFPGGASPYDVHDMAGNVWEWTLSDYNAYPYQADDEQEDKNRTNVRKVLRGGSWDYSGNDVRAALRYYRVPGNRYYFVGFRCVVVGRGAPGVVS
jgi:formylglycine-generating enzyme required for sulfatase activity